MDYAKIQEIVDFYFIKLLKFQNFFIKNFISPLDNWHI